MRNIMVIGGSGYLGHRVLKALLQKNDLIYALQHKAAVIEHENIRILKGGLETISSGLLAQINPSIIFHCGRPTFSRFRFLGRKMAAQKAHKLNKKLITEIKKSQIKTALVFASGSLAYGNSLIPHDESSDLNPISYSRQYLKGELPIVHEKGTGNLKVLTLRFPWLLGAASWFKWFYLQNIEKSAEIPLFGKGNNYMSIIDINDAATLMIKYAEEVDESGIFNIFSPSQIIQKEFVETVARVFNVKVVPHSTIYPKLEAAALDAFQSNILLSTRHASLLSRYKFKGLEETLSEISRNL